MSINSMYSMNRMLRFGGLASGLDTDSIVKDLMRVEQMKVDKLKQERQLLEWRRNDYREVTNLLRGFNDKYFDILYAETNMFSPNTYNIYSIQSSNEAYITATPNSGAMIANHEITSIKMATAAYAQTPSGGNGVAASKELVGSKPIDAAFLSDIKGKMVTITVDGTTKMIEFSEDYENAEDFKAKFQALLNKEFGENRIQVDIVSDRLLLKADTSVITIMGGTAQGILGFGLAQSNRINLDSTLIGLQGQFNNGLDMTDNKVQFTINGKSFTFSGNDTLRYIMSEINASDAGVTLSYSSLNDQFIMQSKTTGAAQTLTVKDSEGSTFLKALGLETVTAGTDAAIVMDGQTIYRSSNTFTIDGVTYNLKRDLKETDAAIDLTMTQNVDKAFDNIKGFVEKYNELIDKLNSELKEERFKDYPPLTDEQRETLGEKEIERWEEKSKSGLLRGDSILQNIVYSMRRAFVEGTEGISIGLSSIGITTGHYTEGGKLHIDERKLKEALQTKGDQVMQLFTKKSDIDYSPDLTSDQRTERYKESGLMQRISDILQDNIRTRRDKDGYKGTLLEKAGVVGDASEFKNRMGEQLNKLSDRIEDAIERMYRAEDRYWRQFTAMERALQQMNAQSAWLAQQFGGGM